MKTAILLCKEDQASGGLGLCVKGLHVMNYTSMAREGLLIAHDLIEHQNGIGAIGSIGDELEALGAIWYVRGQWGDIRRPMHHSAESNLAADLTNMGTMFCQGIPLRLPIPRTRENLFDDAFKQVIEISKGDIPPELGEGYNRQSVKEYLDASLHFMRSGAVKARRKYERYGRFYANSMFWHIAEAVEPYAKKCSIEGQEYKLSYNAESATCEEHYPEE